MGAINAAELIERLQTGETINLLDVREAIEYHTHNIGGKNIPLAEVEEGANQLGYNKTDEIIVICRAGIRSETARKILEQKGYQKVRNLTGGLLAIQRLNNNHI